MPTLISRPGTVPALVQAATIREYPLTRHAEGDMLMRPVVDQQGRVWFGVMASNLIAMFDPQSARWHTVAPPRGRGGLMGMAVAQDGTLWFAEQYANYIGHYEPRTGRFRLYPLPTVTAPDPAHKGKELTLPVAPNELLLDRQGQVWFTEMNADALGRLNPATGELRQYPLASHHTVQQLNPYGLASDAYGHLWFTESSQNRIGYLDPRTGQIATFVTPDAGAMPMEIAVDQQGQVWVTTFAHNLLLRFNPLNHQFTRYYAPTPDGSSGGLYGLSLEDGSVWVTVAAANAIARLVPEQQRFLYYLVPTTSSFPFGVSAISQRQVWFTEAGANQLGLLTLP
ncbi:SMP-30/gluconolactonase/LRE family protein [Thermogemmatispora sp.]|uniref:Vgb family protein n=1 Tax=Thermogemmatispora sp. TaxID=1968838 RepID=UPI001D7643D4|nr:SMP-30/gluconolactonase/LRE family protein [Thermogemmatispora sp.]MBX5450519.1 SMP-30/gluconolactonase/LRE family protein [Thermogemmatispora sp.]